jgi:hypothetical protein
MPTSTIHSRVLLHAVNLRHGTDGLTSPPKEGVRRIVLPLKIRQLPPGLNTRTWILKAKTLPLVAYLIFLKGRKRLDQLRNRKPLCKDSSARWVGIRYLTAYT